jgi:predicted metal-dependent HD superfamily phosphohydrolase
MDRQRWSALCSRFGCSDAELRFAELEKCYSESHRHYHTATHIEECFTFFDSVAVLADHPDEVEFAIWLHDAIYRPLRSDNEERSADLAAQWLRSCEVHSAAVDRIVRLILATRHAAPPGTGDEALLQDIDLAVLGSSPERYHEYEDQIRQEYRGVPALTFRDRRAEILESFLERDTIYRTDWFVERLEADARRNVTTSVARLRGHGV